MVLAGMSAEDHLTNVRAGVVLAGCYRVLSVLGTGGSSIVLDTEHTSSRQRYAVKVYDPVFLESRPGGVIEFLVIAKKLSRVAGPHTIRVVSSGLLGSGAPFLALEYAVGVDLRRLVKDAGPLSYEDAAQMLAQACESLEQAHVLGIAHREVRPSNMFLVEPKPGEHVLKLANYSVGGIVDGPTVSGTDDGAAVEYAAPEVLRGGATDVRVDVWALGVSFYELTTGRRPWTAVDLGRLVDARVVITPPPLRPPSGQAPSPLLIDWLDRCLSDDPEERFPDAREAKLALLRAVPPSPSPSAIVPAPVQTQRMLPDLSGNDEEPAPWSAGDPTRVDARALGVAETEVAEAPPPSSIRGGLDATIVRRPAFSQHDIPGAADSATTVQQNPLAGRLSLQPPLRLPEFVIKEASPVGRNLLLGGVAFALVVGLPLYYVYQRGRVPVEPPEPVVMEVAPPPAPSIENVTGRLQHERVTTAASSGPQRFFMVPPAQTTRKR